VTSVVAAAAAIALLDPAHAVKLDGTPRNKNADPAHTASAQTGNSLASPAPKNSAGRSPSRSKAVDAATSADVADVNSTARLALSMKTSCGSAQTELTLT